MNHSIFAILLTSSLIFSCSDKAKQDVKIAPETKNAPTITPIESEYFQGSVPRFRDALSLTQIYSRIFEKNSNRFQRCQGPDYWCENSLFSIDEARELNSFSLPNKLEGFTQNQDLNLNYLRTLRVMLERECRVLTDSEWEVANENETNSSNSLISIRQVPKAEQLNQFVAQILGIDKTNLLYDAGGDDYAKNFAKSLKENPNASMKDLYLNTCVALALDPAILIY